MNISLTTDGKFRIGTDKHEVIVPATVIGLRFIREMLEGEAFGEIKLGQRGAPTQFEIDKAMKEWQDKVFGPPLIEVELDL